MAQVFSRQIAGRIFVLGFIVLVYIFLLTPLVVVVIASFDSAEILSFPIEGFSLKWYKKALSTEGVWLDSILLSVKIAVLATIISTIPLRWASQEGSPILDPSVPLWVCSLLGCPVGNRINGHPLVDITVVRCSSSAAAAITPSATDHDCESPARITVPLEPTSGHVQCVRSLLPTQSFRITVCWPTGQSSPHPCRAPTANKMVSANGTKRVRATMGASRRPLKRGENLTGFSTHR